MKVNKVKGIKCYIKNRLPSKVQMFNFRVTSPTGSPRSAPALPPYFICYPPF